LQQEHNVQKGDPVIRRIGLTGGIASGKSQVAEMLSGLLDCVHIDADEICRLLLEPQAEGWQELSRVFGSAYLGEGGEIDRALLRKDLFADRDFRQKVNDIIHPLVKSRLLAQMAEILKSDASAFVLVEVPLLFEVGWRDMFDTVIVVYADYETCLERLMARDGVEQAVAVKELESQLPLSAKVELADHVIDNSGTLSVTTTQVEHLAALLAKNCRS